MNVLPKIQEFEWDSGNSQKNVLKHRVTNEECEEAFFDPNKRIIRDIAHSHDEKRYVLFGKTKLGRLLFIVFTLRASKIRVISARDLNKKERKPYEKST